MKLRTAMRIDSTWTAPIGEDGDIEDDAAAAHALMQAIQEFRQDAFGGEPYEILDAVEERASEIMAEWGFDSGEVDSGHKA